MGEAGGRGIGGGTWLSLSYTSFLLLSLSKKEPRLCSLPPGAASQAQDPEI